MRLTFQPILDYSTYEKAKGKTATSGAKSKSGKRPPTISTVKQNPRPSGNVEVGTDDEYPSVEDLLNNPEDVYDLTGIQDPPESPEPARQQLTPEADSTDQGRETTAHEVGIRCSETDHRRSCLPNGGEGSANGLDMSELSGKEDGQQPTPPHTSPASAYDLGEAADPSNAAPSLPSEAVSNTSGSHLAPEVAPPTGTSLPHVVEHNPHKLSARSGQLGDCYESIALDGGVCPESPMEGVEESSEGEGVPPGEWEAEEIFGEEEIGGVLHYYVVWKPTVEPEGNLGHMKELIEKWNVEKVRAPHKKQRSGSGVKKPGTRGKCRSKRDRAGSNGRKRGRPRKG